ELVLVYEITPGKTSDLDFAQWEDIDLPLGKVPARGETVSRLQQAMLAMPDPTQRQPILLAAQFYLASLRETEPGLKLVLLWPACEALDRPLRRLLDRKPKDRFWGLKALAESRDESAAVVKDAYKTRTDLAHARPGALDDLVPRAREAADRLEPVV